jgi:hypothetical protein
MAITNPNPVTPGDCGIYWVSSLTLSTPLVAATLRPYDGQYVVGNASKAKRVVADTSKDTAAAALVTAAFAQFQRLASKTAAVKVASVCEADPLSPVRVTALFTDNSTYIIADLMSLIGTDTQVAGVYGQILSYLATK